MIPVQAASSRLVVRLDDLDPFTEDREDQETEVRAALSAFLSSLPATKVQTGRDPVTFSPVYETRGRAFSASEVEELAAGPLEWTYWDEALATPAAGPGYGVTEVAALTLPSLWLGRTAPASTVAMAVQALA